MFALTFLSCVWLSSSKDFFSRTNDLMTFMPERFSCIFAVSPDSVIKDLRYADLENLPSNHDSPRAKGRTATATMASFTFNANIMTKEPRIEEVSKIMLVNPIRRNILTLLASFVGRDIILPFLPSDRCRAQ